MSVKEVSSEIRAFVVKDMIRLRDELKEDAQISSLMYVKALAGDKEVEKLKRDAFASIGQLCIAEDMLDRLNQAFDRLEKVLGESDEHQANQQADMRL